jgi:hypothetical protein
MDPSQRLPWQQVSNVLLYHGKYLYATIKLQVLTNLLTLVSTMKKSAPFYFWNWSIVCSNFFTYYNVTGAFKKIHPKRLYFVLFAFKRISDAEKEFSYKINSDELNGNFVFHSLKFNCTFFFSYYHSQSFFLPFSPITV